MSEYLKYFPYGAPRRPQLEIMETVYNAVKKGRDVLLEAASGVGKTAAVITALIPLIEDHKIIFVSRTRMEADHVLEEIKRISRKTAVRGVTIQGRRSLCLNPRVSRLPPQISEKICNLLRSAHACPYARAINSEMFINRTSKEMREIGVRTGCCPYVSMLAYIETADVVSLTYSYVLNDFLREKFLTPVTYSSPKPPIYVLDEAHNLQDLVHSMTCDSITLNDLKMALKDAETMDLKNAANTLNTLIKKILLASRGLYLNGDYRIIKLRFDEELLDFIKAAEQASLSYEDGGFNISMNLVKTCEFLTNLIRNRTDHILLVGRVNDQLVLELFNSNPVMLRNIFKKRWSMIAMSATLSPADLYAQLLGAKNPVSKSIPSPYVENGLYIIYTGITTAFRRRDRKMYYDILDITSKIERALPKDSSLAIFVPSKEILKQLIDEGIKYFLERKVVLDSETDIAAVNAKGVAYIGVLGGRLSEGVNIRVDACVIFGVPYGKPDVKNKLILKGYSRIFPGKARRYAYVMPAVRRALQAAGRIIRGPRDRGVAVFADNRYVKLSSFFPCWMRHRLEVVSDAMRLIARVHGFLCINVNAQ